MAREKATIFARSGLWAFWLHRVTGLGVVVFVFLHIIDTVLLAGGAALYDRVVAYFALPPFRWLEALLVSALAYHAVNGLRITIVELRLTSELSESAKLFGVLSTRKEALFWLFMRASGVLLLFLALGHLYAVHIANPSGAVSYAFVTARWTNPLWRLFDWLLLALGILHGWNGLRIVVEDHVANLLRRQLALRLLQTSGLILFLSGTLVTLTFPLQLWK